MRVHIAADRCQGHGRCYELASDVFDADAEGYAAVLGDGTVPSDLERSARLSAANCPESAVILSETEP
jgi:ferredoxin